MCKFTSEIQFLILPGGLANIVLWKLAPMVGKLMSLARSQGTGVVSKLPETNDKADKRRPIIM